ncbi:hypothetical protein CHMI_02015 [Cellulomonas hominis]|nr:hypothetical protein CHMI_02015 [Cellulomonas hominis]
MTGLLVALGLVGLGTAGVLGTVVGVQEPGVTVLTSPPPAPSGTPSGSPSPVADPATGSLPPVPVAPATPPPAGAADALAPVRVVVPAHDIDVPVDPVGVAADGQMEIPPLAERGGWYRFGADPGDATGTTVVAAHVDSVASAGTGPFVRLGDVAPGEQVEVGLADGSARSYRVESVTRFPKSEARWPDVFTRDGPARLALVTCGGAFDTGTRRYTDNVLVIATPVGA